MQKKKRIATDVHHEQHNHKIKKKNVPKIANWQPAKLFKVVAGKFLVANHFYLFQFSAHLKKSGEKFLKCTPPQPSKMK